jgi:hypothetical protein
LAAIIHLSDWLEASTGVSLGAGTSPGVDAAPGAEISPAVGATPGAGSAPGPAIAPGAGTEAMAATDGATGPTVNGQDAGLAPVAETPADPFCASGPLDPVALEVLGLRPQDLEGLRLAVAAERWRAEALVSLLP